jgi:hypothetical protein
VLTGSFGSGKTTLLRRVPADPAMRKTAVVIDQSGETGLDRHTQATNGHDAAALPRLPGRVAPAAISARSRPSPTVRARAQEAFRGTVDEVPSISVLTGFRGSAKTMLPCWPLADLATNDTAVVIDQSGETALTILLVAACPGGNWPPRRCIPVPPPRIALPHFRAGPAGRMVGARA